MVEEGTGTDSASEPLSLSKANHQWAEDVLELLIGKILANFGQRFRGLFTYYGLVRLGKSFQEGQETRFVWVQLPNIAQFFCNSEEHFVVLVLNQCYIKQIQAA